MYSVRFDKKYDPSVPQTNQEQAGKFFLKHILVPVLALMVLLVVGASVAIGNVQSNHGRRIYDRRQMSSKVVEPACGVTLYRDVCVSTLLSHPESLKADSTKDLAKIAVKVAMDEVKAVSSLTTEMSRHPKDHNDLAAVRDCIELFGYTTLHLNDSLLDLMTLNAEATTKQQAGDLQTWLSACLTNQETCIDGFQGSDGNVKSVLNDRLQNLSKLVSNALALANNIPIVGSDGEHLAVTSRNRRLLSNPIGSTVTRFSNEFLSNYGSIVDGFPVWLSSADRRLLQAPQRGIQADAVVAKDGTGNYKTITEAVDAAPAKNNGRYTIHVKAGVYAEKVVVSKQNIMLIGDGKDVTVVTGSKSFDGGSTKLTATLAATGEGFIARDMTFENTAGPDQNQAVALRVASDLSVLYRCSIRGYQDTLFAHSHRQFYRECDIYGTVDFIFGNAASVFQSCNILVRKPRSGQMNFITAQGRTDPNQNTGFSIHSCRVTAASDLAPVKSSFPTYLGRPWKEYSRTVYLQSILDDLINPAGWFEWSGSFALKTLYYGEYMNSGPGADTSRRVTWPGYRVITSAEEASKFTVAEFISGNAWLPSTGVVYQSGLIG